MSQLRDSVRLSINVIPGTEFSLGPESSLPAQNFWSFIDPSIYYYENTGQPQYSVWGEMNYVKTFTFLCRIYFNNSRTITRFSKMVL
jgi:hypothetical protein